MLLKQIKFPKGKREKKQREKENIATVYVGCAEALRYSRRIYVRERISAGGARANGIIPVPREKELASLHSVRFVCSLNQTPHLPSPRASGQ